MLAESSNFEDGQAVAACACLVGSRGKKVMGFSEAARTGGFCFFCCGGGFVSDGLDFDCSYAVL